MMKMKKISLVGFDSLGLQYCSQKKNTTRNKKKNDKKKKNLPARARTFEGTNTTTTTAPRGDAREKREKSALSRSFCFDFFANLLEEREREREDEC